MDNNSNSFESEPTGTTENIKGENSLETTESYQESGESNSEPEGKETISLENTGLNVEKLNEKLTRADTTNIGTIDNEFSQEKPLDEQNNETIKKDFTESIDKSMAKYCLAWTQMRRTLGLNDENTRISFNSEGKSIGLAINIDRKTLYDSFLKYTKHDADTFINILREGNAIINEQKKYEPDFIAKKNPEIYIGLATHIEIMKENLAGIESKNDKASKSLDQMEKIKDSDPEILEIYECLSQALEMRKNLAEELKKSLAIAETEFAKKPQELEVNQEQIQEHRAKNRKNLEEDLSRTQELEKSGDIEKMPEQENKFEQKDQDKTETKTFPEENFREIAENALSKVEASFKQPNSPLRFESRFEINKIKISDLKFEKSYLETIKESFVDNKSAKVIKARGEVIKELAAIEIKIIIFQRENELLLKYANEQAKKDTKEAKIWQASLREISKTETVDSFQQLDSLTSEYNSLTVTEQKK